MAYYDRGRLSLITGRMGSGKTDFGLYLAERSQQKVKDLVIISNVALTRKRDNYIWCNSLSKLLKAMTEVKRGLLIIDEAGIYATSGAGGSWKDNGQWVRFIKMQRKFGISTIWIDQTVDGSVLPAIRNLALYKFVKSKMDRTNQYYVDIFIHGEEKDEWDLVKGYQVGPDSVTSLPYDTDDIGSFKMDLPFDLTIKDVFDHLSDFRSSEVRPALKKWLEDIETKKQEAEAGEERKDTSEPWEILTKRDAIFFLMELHQPEDTRSYPRNKDLKKILNISDQYARSIKKEWFKVKSQDQ